MRGLILSIFTISGLLAQTVHITGNYLDLLDNPIDSASVYYYQDLVVVDSTLTNPAGAFDLQFTVVSTSPAVPSAFSLSQNYPNPFNPSTRIDLSIQEPGTFAIYDIRGALVEKAELPSAGGYELTWGAKNLGAGLYIYVLRSGSHSSSRKMILLDGGDGSGLSASQVSFSTPSSLAKPASNDAIRFEKYNTTLLEIDFFTPETDTSLGVIHGNVGPVLIQVIPDTSFVVGEPWGLDWNDYFYNDSETMYLESVFVPPDSGDTHYMVQATDLIDSTLSTLSNVFTVIVIPINPWPTFNLPDTLLAFEDSSGILIPNFNLMRTDTGSQAVNYAVFSQSNPELVNLFMANDTALAYQTILENGFGQSQLIASITDGENTTYDSALVIVQDVFDPTIPALSLPDTLFGFEDSSGILISNLNAYRTDGGLQAVLYAISNQTNPDLVNASIQDTILQYNALLANQSGQSIITVAIDDGSNYSQDNALLLVQPVNDPIRYIGNLENQETAEDSSLTIDLRSEFENLDNDILDYIVTHLGQPLENATQVDNNGIITITPNADWNGTLDSLVAQARVQGTDEVAQSDLFDVYVAPRPDAPTLELTPVVSNVNEDRQGEIVIANFAGADVDGDSLIYSFYNSQPDSVFLRMVGSQILLDSLARNFNGIANYGVTINDGQTEVSEQSSLIINPQADVTLRIRTLNYAGTPIMDNIMSTFQIGDSTYQAIGQITKQVSPGTYEIWAENDSTGIFLDTLRADNYISIRTGQGNPLITPALATRSLGDQSSAVTFGTEDMVLELYKISNLSNEDKLIMHSIINNDGPDGIIKPNTATPECYIDTSFAAYSEPSPEMIANAQYIAEVLMPLASEGRYTPIWMSFGTSPNSDPNGETVLMFVFDTQYSPPGNSSNLINDNNVLYYASVLSHPTANSLAGLAGEASQGFTAMQGDLPGGNEVTYLLKFNDQGQIVPTEFAKFMHRVRDYFNPGDNI